MGTRHPGSERPGPEPTAARAAGAAADDMAGLVAARDRAMALQRITAALSQAATADAALEVVLTELVAGVDGDGAAAALLDDKAGTLHVRGAIGYQASIVESLRQFDVDSPLPLALAVRRRRRVFYPDKAHTVAENPGIEQLVPALRDRALGAWPLIVADRVIGSLGLTWAGPHQLGDDALSFVDAVAGQLAQAVDRARLYEAEATARREAERTAGQLAFLAEASRVLGATLDLDETLKRLADTVVPRLADWCVVYLRDERGEPLPVAISHQDPERVAMVEELQRRWPTRLSAPAGAGLVMRTGETQVLEDVTDELLRELAEDADHLALLRAVELGSGAVVPLRIRGRVVGAMACANSRQRSLDREHVALLREVAGRAAVAVSHAQAYAERSSVADELQQSLLPARLPEVPGLEVAVRYRAAGAGVEVGGDFYDLFAGRGGRWMLTIGDVRGKGVASSALTGLARHTIRCAALHSRSPRRILADLNTMLLRADAEHTDDEAAEPRFATVCLAGVVPGEDVTSVTLCHAGHPLAMLVRADGTVTPAGEPGPLLGVFDAPALTERTVRLRPGDALVWYTDGISERRAGDAYFEDDLPAVLAGLADASADVLAEKLQHAALTFGAAPPGDDMALVVLRHPPG